MVLDASAVLELVLATPLGHALAERVDWPAGSLHAPELLDVEVCSVLRRYALTGALSPQDGEQALIDLIRLPLHRYPHHDLLPRAWQLRDTHTAYDGVYVALAENLGAPLITTDARLARSHGHQARIELVEA